MPRKESSFSSNTKDQGSFTKIPWYLENAENHVDFNASRASRLSRNSTVAWTKMSQSSQIYPMENSEGVSISKSLKNEEILFF